ncbi:site-specific DNA-methyltransferase [Marinirhabdus gelatinilytica]|uniref:site-specific DNA-methyltransferase (adenine-specific) n=1 Tax=Marinirhabdus gelatinilytica TaxID=1703343 RepID=A0A370QAG1_9FLAO|nr:site-specific DNA-methyltransferase [Marinirhabdus gelatinilytica]RDK85356.1 adenine-specific DNA-methyltransferase [Marinirhabdus gelatinilytica]
MSKEQKITGNIQPPNKDLEILRQNFPNCFDKSGEFDFEKFKTQLSKNEINFSKESYGMDWLGKSYARLLATDEATTLLKEDETFNQKDENKNSGNLLIKGDNLEVLKHLSNAYYKKIKMIYIDPPYNTGSDGFVYSDDRKFTIEELQELAGINEERAKRILDFTQSNSNSHSAWLTFMYPRLYIAKQLLKDDGVIFISIDDNEVAQLKLLMDEIFGEENFVSEFIWEKKKKPSFLHKNVGKLSEYITCYVNNSSKTFPFSIEKTTEGKKYPFNNAGNSLEELTFPPQTVEFSIEDCTVKPQDMSEGKIITELLNELIVKDGLNENEFTLKGEWRYSQNTLNEIIKNKEKISISKIPFRPNHIKIGGEIKKMKNSFSPTHYEMETNEDATKQIVSLFGIDLFSNPKPTKLIKTIIKAISYNDPKAIILDFFAGSGTTGDAVMQLNAKDAGNRKFILAQLPELIDQKSNQTAYDFVKNELKVETPTIFDITKERLVRASKKIQGEREGEDLSNQDLGFKVFETMPIWEDYTFESEELEKQTSLFDESKLTKEDIKALLVTWKTYDGIPLTETIQDTNLDGYTAHYSSEKLYLMDKGFTTENLKLLLEKIDNDKGFNPTSIIAFGYHFESKSLREISENIKSYANKKSIDIDFITRF